MKNRLARLSLAAALVSLALAGPAGAQVPPQSKLYPITPCRIADTRLTPNGNGAGPVLQANAGRAFQIAGTCGIPATARSVVLNVTAVNATANGSFAIFPTGTPVAAGRDGAQLPRRQGARGLASSRGSGRPATSSCGRSSRAGRST